LLKFQKESSGIQKAELEYRGFFKGDGTEERQRVQQGSTSELSLQSGVWQKAPPSPLAAGELTSSWASMAGGS